MFKEYLNDIWERRDRRTDGWFLVDSIAINLAITAAYLVLVTVVGPRIMKNRQAYSLRGLLMIYNLFQVVYCSYLVYVAGSRGWITGNYSWSKFKIIFFTMFRCFFP